MIAIILHGKIRIVREGGVGSGNYGHTGRPGVRGGSAPSGASPKLVHQIYQHIGKEGGITIDVHGNMPHSGFAIGGNVTPQVKPWRDVTEKDISKFINTHIGELTKAHQYLGAWIATPNCHLDVTTLGSDLKDSLDQAFSRDEIAITDLSDFKDHYTMSDHLRPSESKGERIYESQRPSKGGTKLLLFGKDVSTADILKAIRAEGARQEKSGRKTITIKPKVDRG